MPSDSERLAWVAGMLDGEGSIAFFPGRSVERRPRKGLGMRVAWQVVVTISNTHAPTIAAIREVVGFGNTRTAPAYVRRGKLSQICLKWKVSSRRAEMFLKMVQPFVITKHEQVRIVLAAIALRRTAPRAPLRGAPLTAETHARLKGLQDELHRANSGGSLRRLSNGRAEVVAGDGAPAEVKGERGC